MRLMLIGTDRTLFTKGAAVRERIVRFGNEYTEGLDSIVFSTTRHGIEESQELAQKVHAYPTRSRSRFLYIWDALKQAKKLPKPDIVSAQDPFETGLAAYFIARYFKVPFAVEVHTDFLAKAFSDLSLLNKIRILIARFVLARAVGGYVVSERVRQEMLKKYSKIGTFKVLPIYIDLSSYSRLEHVPHPHFKTALLWVGRMEEEKNPELALEAFIQARAQGFDGGITFVGSGSHLKNLQDTVQAQGLSEWVTFVGTVSDVKPYYQTADLMLVTSKYEGYGMALVEALAAHVPVLSTDVGVAREAGATIADTDFTKSLIQYLAEKSAQPARTLPTYINEQDYFDQVRTHYQSLITHPDHL
jgi:glycosyltransferase involved in cell wall biosynthesis